MTATAIKPLHPLHRLHLGCGESLSQLLPAEPPREPKPARPVSAGPRRRGERHDGGDR